MAPKDKREVWTVFVDPRFPAGFKAGVMQGVHDWEKALRQVRRTQVTFDPTVPADVIITVGEWEPDEDGSLILGVCNDLGGRMIRLNYVGLEMLNFNVAQVTAHELGHALGARHHFFTLMNPSADEFQLDCVDEDTAKQVSDAHGWLEGAVLTTCPE